MKTEDGEEIRYNVPFWSVCTNNHPININTRQERKLYVPIETVIHSGAKINTYGLKFFSTKLIALQWCVDNKPQ